MKAVINRDLSKFFYKNFYLGSTSLTLNLLDFLNGPVPFLELSIIKFGDFKLRT